MSEGGVGGGMERSEGGNERKRRKEEIKRVRKV